MDRAGYVYALITAFSIALGVWFGVQEYNLDKHGLRTTATVYKVTSNTTYNQQDNTSSTTYEGRMTYKVNGQSYDFRTSVPSETEKGQEFPIVYDPQNPSTAAVDLQLDVYMPAIWCAVSATVFATLTLYTWSRRLTVTTQRGFGSRMRNYNSKNSVKETEWL